MIDTEEHTLFGLEMRSSHLVLGTDTEVLVTNTILQLSLPMWTISESLAQSQKRNLSTEPVVSKATE